MKATHNGTCQACGNVQALRWKSEGLQVARLTLAKHGYTVAGGWFSGVCHGSGEVPLECSTEVLDEIVALAEGRIQAIEEWLDKDILKLGPVQVKWRETVWAKSQTRGCWSEADRDAIDSQWTEAWASALRGQRGRWSNQRSELKGLVNLLEGLRASRHGQPVYDRATLEAK